MGIQGKKFLFGAFLGIGMLLGIIRFLPDGRLHVVFCDVGQGDAIYIRFPNNADMLVDGGPDNKVLTCLGRHMPFYDRTLDLVFMTHPQKDHLQGLIEVLRRYEIKNFLTIPLANTTESYHSLVRLLRTKALSMRYPNTGDRLKVGEADISVLWPEKNWLAEELKINPQLLANKTTGPNVLGFATDRDLNLFCLYLHLQYGEFDLLLTGDGDQNTQMQMTKLGLDKLLAQATEVLKVPHHGSRTGMTEEFLNRVRPQLSIIEVGKNSYGHPNPGTVKSLESWGKVLRTDTSGDIEIIATKNSWETITQR